MDEFPQIEKCQINKDEDIIYSNPILEKDEDIIYSNPILENAEV